MRHKLVIAGLVAALAAWPAVLGASGDVGCSARWTLAAPTLDCANRIVIGPGNDTRVNLMLLLRDRAGLPGAGADYSEAEWAASYYGRTFFEWGHLVDSLYPAEPAADPYGERGEFAGSRCQSVAAGGAQFLAAADRNRRIGARDRAALAAGREALLALCRSTSGYRSYGEEEDAAAPASTELPHSYASLEAREFGAYLAGAAGFYGGDWRAARERFAGLRTARDEWVRETALYMAARSELGAANAAAMDEWGSFDADAADKAGADRAARAFAAYLEAYPAGRYAASAAGLVRRAYWLQGATRAQGLVYARLLAAADPKAPDAAELIDEIDNKFLLADGAGEGLEGPLLLAVHDLMRMRDDGDPEGDWERYELPRLTAGELAAHEPAFAGEPELYAFLQANFAFYVERDYRAVLRLLPDDARQPAYGPLSFSRQALRGLALAALDDRNEAGFWQELIGGADGVYQRPTVELALALAWERGGEVGKVFAAGSPIEDSLTRTILLEHAAGPEVLRAAAVDAGRPPRERDTAAFVLLFKELSRGSYAAAVRDFGLARTDAPTEGWLGDLAVNDAVPLGLFVRGTFADGYACPALRETAAALARNADDVKGRLCLGDFYRLNGFDYLALDGARQEGELGSFARYPGEPIPRSALYNAVIAEPGVAREDRAYALFRAVHCYAPSGNNTCGGEDAPEAQRRAWFRRLKGEFATTRWGREAE